jgi:hypothetical protein
MDQNGSLTDAPKQELRKSTATSRSEAITEDRLSEHHFG